MFSVCDKEKVAFHIKVFEEKVLHEMVALLKFLGFFWRAFLVYLYI